jgi:hypothetical protein
MPRFQLRARLVAGVGIALLMAPVAAGQTAPAQAIKAAKANAAAPAILPRTPAGHPDFQGVVWTATSDFFAPLEAGPMMPAQLVLPEDEARKTFGRMMAMFMSPAVMKMIEDLDPEVAEILRNMKGLPLVRGERRTRMLVLPADGKLPMTPEARKEMPVGLDLPALKADNPEDRGSSERCLSTPPPIAVVFDMPMSFVQTPDHVVIHGEFADARIIPLAEKSMLAASGSVARWDGDTLVVETTGFLARDRVRPLFGGALIVNPDAKVIERYTRISADELVYQFTVDDPKAYTAPWLAEYSLYRASYRMYPSSCHEANYSLGNILRGQRVADERAAASKRR